MKTKPGSDKLVEFAVKLPGQAEDDRSVYLPIDAKFPKDVYEQLLDAYESGDLQRVGTTSRMLEQTIRGMAKDIRDKYLAPPYTTDFGIMFLPFESIYGEVTRRAALLEQLQQEYHVIVTGPPRWRQFSTACKWDSARLPSKNVVAKCGAFLAA